MWSLSQALGPPGVDVAVGAVPVGPPPGVDVGVATAPGVLVAGTGVDVFTGVGVSPLWS